MMVVVSMEPFSLRVAASRYFLFSPLTLVTPRPGPCNLGKVYVSGPPLPPELRQRPPLAPEWISTAGRKLLHQ